MSLKSMKIYLSYEDIANVITGNSMLILPEDAKLVFLEARAKAKNCTSEGCSETIGCWYRVDSESYAEVHGEIPAEQMYLVVGRQEEKACH